MWIRDVDKTLFIGVDLGGTNLRVGAVDRHGQVFYRNMLPTQVSLGLHEVVERIIYLIGEVIHQVKASGSLIGGIGIGSPGIIDIGSGTIISSPNFPEWKHVPLKEMIENRLGLPTLVDNDANAFAFGEKWAGVGKKVRSLICLTLGTGVGGGIVFNDRIWHGADGMAAEIGHMTIVPDGLKCNCGNYGCLEMYASASSIVRRIRAALEAGQSSKVLEQVGGKMEEITPDLVYQLALEGDPLAVKIMKETATYLGIGIANLINLLNPEMIILGGGLTNAWDFLYPLTVAEVQKRAFPIPARRAQIVRASLRDNAGIIGAAGIIYYTLGDSL